MVLYTGVVYLVVILSLFGYTRTYFRTHMVELKYPRICDKFHAGVKWN